MKLQGLSKKQIRKIAQELPQNDKVIALADFLGITSDEIEESRYGEFVTSEGDYRVLSEEEADEAVKVEILDSLWAFRTDFIFNFMIIKTNPNVLKAIQQMQESLSEDANDIMKALVGENIDELVNEAVSSAGRGHFLSSYDGEENESGGFFIYRTN
ncbi:MAG TPA: hypothetical protein VGB37_06365 [Candidatus Lokiarchaeia archaeon]